MPLKMKRQLLLLGMKERQMIKSAQSLLNYFTDRYFLMELA